MLDEQLDIRDKLKPIERRLPILKKHIEHADIYFKLKGKKPLTDSEQTLYAAAHTYLKGVMNGHTSLPVKAWKTEYAKLTAEQIRKSVYSILRQEQQPRRAQNVDR